MNQRNDVIAKILLFDGNHTYDKRCMRKNDIEFIAIADLKKLKTKAKTENKHIALVSDDFKFFIERS
jgi:hypothetical protein